MYATLNVAKAQLINKFSINLSKTYKLLVNSAVCCGAPISVVNIGSLADQVAETSNRSASRSGTDGGRVPLVSGVAGTEESVSK